MDQENESDKERRHKRIRFIKKFLKRMPRRDNIHRYPVLKWFAKSAKQRVYLWSFRVSEVEPALYAGWILTLLPVMSIQIFLACMLAFLFRANIMILVALQFVSTPFTVPFLWYTAYKVGDFTVKLFGTSAIESIQKSYEQAGIEKMSDIFIHGQQCMRWFFTTSLGGIILGVIIGHISALIYRRLARLYNERHDI